MINLDGTKSTQQLIIICRPLETLKISHRQTLTIQYICCAVKVIRGGFFNTENKNTSKPGNKRANSTRERHGIYHQGSIQYPSIRHGGRFGSRKVFVSTMF